MFSPFFNFHINILKEVTGLCGNDILLKGCKDISTGTLPPRLSETMRHIDSMLPL